MRTLGQHALCAKEIRKILKKAFPMVKFSVRSTSYSMGDNVTVDWKDGVSSTAVKELISHFEYGSFDGMTDCYNYDNNIESIPQTKFLMINRNFSDEIMEEAFVIIKDVWDCFRDCKDINSRSNSGFNTTPAQYIYRKLVDNEDLTKGLRKETFFTLYS